MFVVLSLRRWRLLWEGSHNIGRYDLPGFRKIPRKHNTLWTSICGLITLADVTTLDVLYYSTIHARPMILTTDKGLFRHFICTCSSFFYSVCVHSHLQLQPFDSESLSSWLYYWMILFLNEYLPNLYRTSISTGTI